MEKVFLVTSNEERYKFINSAVSAYGVLLERVSLKLDEIQADTVELVAQKKASTAAKQINAPCICEDTELTIAALGGFPGPYMKYAQDKLSPEKILLMMKEENNRGAIFKSVLVYAEPSGFIKMFETKLDGEITKEKIGTNGRKWDPIFLIKSKGKTLAEFLPEERFSLWNSGYNELGKWLSKR